MNTWRIENLSVPGRLHGVSLELQRGEVVALLGPSGAGKSTLLHALAGLLDRYEGVVPAAPGRVALAFQQPALWDHLNAREHLTLVAPRDAKPDHTDRLLRATNLTDLARRKPPQLSGGEQRRLGFARALAADPDWLLLDEPTAFLDGPHRDAMLNLLRPTLSDTTAGVVLATHHADEALCLADSVVVLDNGRVLATGAPDDLYHDPPDLTTARTLGPASALPGHYDAGRWIVDGAVAITGVPDRFASRDMLLLRPDALEFTKAGDGHAIAVDTRFAGRAYRTRVTVAGHELGIDEPQPIAAGTRGRLAWRAPTRPEH